MRQIDKFLNSMTMYRVILYGLLVLVGSSLALSAFGVLGYNFGGMIASLIIIVAICYPLNYLFAWLVGAPRNVESALITSLILFLIWRPISSAAGIMPLVMLGTLAMASKYLLAINRKHVFNPAAIAALIMSALSFGGAIWWAGSSVMLPIVAVVGLLIIRKIRRIQMFLAFAVTVIIVIFVYGLMQNQVPLELLSSIFTSWPLVFFGTIMLTEPLTSAPTSQTRIMYAVLVGLLFGAQFRIGTISATPQLALVIGNIFAYIVSSKQRLVLKLKDKIVSETGIYDFVFTPNQELRFAAGQYMEWTLPQTASDSRGNRRYFTVASSPTEQEVRLGIRIDPKRSSAFKQYLVAMKPGARLYAGQLAGDFVLPEDKAKKLVFIAGGIGITPFRSMVKYLIDKGQQRDITLLYSAASDKSFAYQDVFDAGKAVGVKAEYVIAPAENAPASWKGKTGFITAEMIQSTVKNSKSATYYLSGPSAMVTNYRSLLRGMGVPPQAIISDYFPGF